MNIKKILHKVFLFFCVIPIIVIGYFGIQYYWKNFKTEEKNITTLISEEMLRSKKFGPWTIGQLEDRGYTKTYERVAPAGELSKSLCLDQGLSWKFSTNPPGKDVGFKNNRKFYKLSENPGDKDGYTWDLCFYFKSNTGSDEEVFIVTGPAKN